MGQYKVPQNVEAEDKIIGPLTLKQFIYTIIGVMIAVVSFLTMRKTPIVMLIVGLPPTALFLMLGLYQRQDQPFEALFLSIVNFLAKPRKRLWQKEPIEEVFKIEAPKVVKHVTQRDPQEVRGQLERLSQIFDSRGTGASSAVHDATNETSLEITDRIAEPAIPQAEQPLAADITAADDILDFQNNPDAHNVGQLIQDQAKVIREEAMAKVKQASSSQGSVDSSQEGSASTTPGLQPTVYAPATAAQTSPQSASDMTTNPLNDILKLAMENDDLTVGQIAAQAKRTSNLAEGESVSLRTNGNSSK